MRYASINLANYNTSLGRGQEPAFRLDRRERCREKPILSCLGQVAGQHLVSVTLMSLALGGVVWGWSGGISNPVTVIERLTYLLFSKRPAELHTLNERKATRTGKPRSSGRCRG